MYIPDNNLMSDPDEIFSFIQRFSFAILITSDNDKPIATHLPFVVEKYEGNIKLSSHLSSINPQSEHIENKNLLVVFSEPHAYISPSLYTHRQNVPTWNYLAVHVYGSGQIIKGLDNTIQLLEKTIDYYEESYKEQWQTLPEKYKKSLAEEIVSFEIRIEKIEAKKKLSQNKTAIERNNIINTLSKRPNTNEQLIAEYMKNM